MLRKHSSVVKEVLFMKIVLAAFDMKILYIFFALALIRLFSLCSTHLIF